MDKKGNTEEVEILPKLTTSTTTNDDESCVNVKKAEISETSEEKEGKDCSELATENGQNTSVEPDKEEVYEMAISEVISEAIDDYIQEQQEQEKRVDALLGGCLDLVCTYSEGYKSRQPLYSCKTCYAKTGQLAGICYGCSDNCHEGHDLVELYTKRNFCCDCGNSKFSEKCKLYQEKDALNGRNRYNDNFTGIFCTCKKAYPPVMDGEEPPNLEDMIQCPVCEDWFHPTHVLSDPAELAKLEPEENEHFDLICSGCVQKLPWLFHYLQHFEEGKGVEEPQQNGNVLMNGTDEEECKLEKLKGKKPVEEGTKEDSAQVAGKKSLCLPLGWREQLCRCQKCKALYEDSDCSFLIDREDTIDFFEQQNREKMARQAEEETKKSSGNATLQRELAIHVKTGIDQMERHCEDFFAKRMAQKHGAAMTKEDVEECFQELAVKRQRLMAGLDGEEEKEAAWTQ